MQFFLAIAQVEPIPFDSAANLSEIVEKIPRCKIRDVK